MSIPNQPPQSNEPNTPTYNYVFNNVPQEQASEIIASVTRNNPSNNVEINFASSITNIPQQTDAFVLSNIIDISPNEIDTPYK